MLGERIPPSCKYGRSLNQKKNQQRKMNKSSDKWNWKENEGNKSMFARNNFRWHFIFKLFFFFPEYGNWWFGVMNHFLQFQYLLFGVMKHFPLWNAFLPLGSESASAKCYRKYSHLMKLEPQKMLKWYQQKIILPWKPLFFLFFSFALENTMHKHRNSFQQHSIFSVNSFFGENGSWRLNSPQVHFLLFGVAMVTSFRKWFSTS